MRNRCFLLVALSVFTTGSQRANAQHSIEPIDEAPVTRAQVEKLLQKPWPDLQLDLDMPLSEILETVVKHMEKEYGTPVSVRRDYRELELTSTSSLEDIMLKHVIFRAGSLTIEQVLTEFFAQTDPSLTFIPGPGYLLVTSPAKVAENFNTRIYDLSPFLFQTAATEEGVATKLPRAKAVHVKHRQTEGATNPIEDEPQKTSRKSERTKRERLNRGQRSSAKRNNAQDRSIDNSSLLELIQTHLSPMCRWVEVDGEGGSIALHGQYAVIRQTAAGHQMIESLLANLQKAINEKGPLTEVNFDRFHKAQAADNFNYGASGSGFGGGMF